MRLLYNDRLDINTHINPNNPLRKRRVFLNAQHLHGREFSGSQSHTVEENVVTIPNNDTLVTYSDAWDHEPNDMPQTSHWTNHTGATVYLPFNGTSISVFGTIQNGTWATYWIDGIQATSVNESFSEQDFASHSLFQSAPLTNAPHTLNISVSSQGAPYQLDHFQVMQPAKATVNPKISEAVAGVLGGCLFLTFMVLILRYVAHRRGLHLFQRLKTKDDDEEHGIFARQQDLNRTYLAEGKYGGETAIVLSPLMMPDIDEDESPAEDPERAQRRMLSSGSTTTVLGVVVCTKPREGDNAALRNAEDHRLSSSTMITVATVATSIHTIPAALLPAARRGSDHLRHSTAMLSAYDGVFRNWPNNPVRKTSGPSPLNPNTETSRRNDQSLAVPLMHDATDLRREPSNASTLTLIDSNSSRHLSTVLTTFPRTGTTNSYGRATSDSIPNLGQYTRF